MKTLQSVKMATGRSRKPVVDDMKDVMKRADMMAIDEFDRNSANLSSLILFLKTIGRNLMRYVETATIPITRR